MARWVTWIVAGLAIAVAAGAAFVTCGLVPERYAVNAPLGHMLLGRGADAPDPATVSGRIRVPPGFSVSVWAEGVPGARFLRWTPGGDLLVSTPRSGRVVRLLGDADGDGRSDGARTVLEGLDRPHGLDLHEGDLYVAETGAILRIPFDGEAGEATGPARRIVDDLPEGGNHWTRTVRVGPDGRLYVTVGSSCNVCEEEDPRRAAMLRYRTDGSGEEIFATGLRNAVGFDWRPATGELYATDNGRDLLGDDFPPCELNRVVEGGFYGWPYANGDRVPDPDLGEGHDERIEASIPPVHGFRAHNAPLGIAFVRGDALPESYRDAALVALHGSWNRTRKDGYRVVSLHWEDGAVRERDFLVGFEVDGDVIGRPVDVAEGPDGAFYVSDDYAGAVYRVAWQGEGARGTAAAARAPAAAAPAGPADPLAHLSSAERRTRAERGRALWERHDCARCHDPAEAPAGMVARPLEGLAARYDVDGLVSFLETPTPPMPALPLTEDERRDLAVHLLSTHPAGASGREDAAGGS